MLVFRGNNGFEVVVSKLNPDRLKLEHWMTLMKMRKFN